MEITATRLDRTVVVSIVGSIDALTAGDVDHYLSAQVDSGQKQIVADLSQVDFMASAGLRAILHALKESRQRGGDLRLAAARPGIDHTLKISGFATVLQYFPTVDQAVASFGPSGT
jgi:anti-sigma B factor antagonist